MSIKKHGHRRFIDKHRLQFFLLPAGGKLYPRRPRGVFKRVLPGVASWGLFIHLIFPLGLPYMEAAKRRSAKLCWRWQRPAVWSDIWGGDPESSDSAVPLHLRHRLPGPSSRYLTPTSRRRRLASGTAMSSLTSRTISWLNYTSNI